MSVLPSPQFLRVTGEWFDAAELRVVEQTGLEHPEGYELEVGRVDGLVTATVTAGGPRGAFYARQTLRQLESGGRIPGVRVEDWPAMPLRGTIEGFYGPPWTHAERLAHLDFLGQYKLNTYVYAPKDDPYHRDQWRDPYPADKLAQLGAIVTRAAANHVEFIFAIHPGRSVIFTSEADFGALVAKTEAVRSLGVRQFSLLLDDIDPQLRDPGDIERFGQDYAAAQVYLCNRYHRYLREVIPGHRLLVCPTEYWQEGSSPYRQTLGAQLDPEIRLFWTGIGVAAATVTREQTAEMHRIYGGHELVLWDNYPVNDYNRHRLNMGYIAAREPGLPGAGQIGLVANPMNEARASRVPLITVADYAWNDQAYEPLTSWEAANLREGGEALRFFSDHCHSFKWAKEEAPLLAAALAADPESHFRRMAELPRAFDPASPLALELAPYLEKLALLGEAGLAALRLRAALGASLPAAEVWAWRAEAERHLAAAKERREQIGGGRVEAYVAEALAEADRFVGLQGSPTETSLPLLPRPAVLTSLTPVDGSDPSLMLDPSVNQCFKLCRYEDGKPVQPRLLPGDHVGLDLGLVRPLSQIRLVMGAPVEWAGPMRSAVLEASADGSAWVTLAALEDRESFTGEFPQFQARFARIRALAAQEKTLWVRHFVVGRPGEDTGAPIPAGASVTWAFAEPVSARQILVLQDSEAPALDAELEVATAAGAWQRLASTQGGVLALSWEGGALVGARLVARGQSCPAQLPRLAIS